MYCIKKNESAHNNCGTARQSKPQFYPLSRRLRAVHIMELYKPFRALCKTKGGMERNEQ